MIRLGYAWSTENKRSTTETIDRMIMAEPPQECFSRFPKNKSLSCLAPSSFWLEGPRFKHSCTWGRKGRTYWYIFLFFYHCIIGSSELYASKLKEKYLGDIPIYSPFYGATEGLIGVNLWPEEENPLYMLVPRAMFFEFIPVEESCEDQPTVCTPCNFSIAVKLLIYLSTCRKNWLFVFRVPRSCFWAFNIRLEIFCRKTTVLDFREWYIHKPFLLYNPSLCLS